MQAIDELAQIRPSALTYLLLELNTCIDECGPNAVSIDQVEAHVASGDILQFLAARFDGHMDLSLLDSDHIAIVIRNLQDINDALGNQARRKCGVENSGLCLLMAWVVEVLQRHPSFSRR